MAVKMACADAIQECLETVRDLKAHNAEEDYLESLDKKIKAVEKRAILTELGTAVFVASAQMILKLGIATVALTGGDAPIILLDEATASLDVEYETLIQSAISQLIRDKTVLIIAHRMRTEQHNPQYVHVADA